MQHHEQSVEIVESVRAGAMQKNLSLSTVTLEILPYLIHIVQPNFKPVEIFSPSRFFKIFAKKTFFRWLMFTVSVKLADNLLVRMA